MTSEYLGNADEISIDSDERGFELWFTTDQGTYRVNVHGAASDLLEAVDRTIRPWWSEGESIRRQMGKKWADDDIKEYERQYAAKRVFACDPDESGGYALDDPKHPDWYSVHADHYDNRERRGLSDMRRDLGRTPTAQEWQDERR